MQFAAMREFGAIVDRIYQGAIDPHVWPGVVSEIADWLNAPKGLLLPHLSRALEVMFKLRDAEFKLASTLAALDYVATGILLMGNDGGVAFANRAARNLLAEADGLAVRRSYAGSGSRLVADDAATQAAIDAALRSAIDPAKPVQVDQDLLPRAYGLTAAEARVAETLCGVSTIEDAAVELSVSANTVKSQLQQVYQKTGTDSRAKLAKLILSLSTTH